MGAAVSGLGLRDLAVLAAEMVARSWQPDGRTRAGAGPDDQGGRPEDRSGRSSPAGTAPVSVRQEPAGRTPGTVRAARDGPARMADGMPDEVFEDRALRLLVTFQGAGVLHGDLTPECAEIVNTVLDALAVPAGPEDSRDQGQRYHDALQEAMTRLIASGLLPERGGQPVKAWVNVSLADLMLLEGSSALLGEWTARLRARLAAHRAARRRAAAGAGIAAGRGWTGTPRGRSRVMRCWRRW